MKLYVWVDPYNVSYGSSMVFAVADSEEQARTVAQTGDAYSFGQYADAHPGVTLGPPTRVVDLPCAEWHKWSE